MTASTVKSINIVVTAIDRTNNILERIARQATSLNTVVLSMGAAFGTVVKTGLDFNSMMEKAEVNFTRLAGSAPKGKQLLDDLMTWTRGTSLPFEQATKSAQEFLARGFQMKEIIPVLDAIGNASAAMPRPMAQSMQIISYNLAQIHSSAILQQKDIRQLADAGVDAWGYLSDAAGKSVGEIKYLLDKQKISFTGDFAFDAILKGLQRDFAGMLEIQRNTAAGQVAEARRTMSELAGIFTQPLFEQLKRGLLEVNAFFRNPSTRDAIRGWADDFAYLLQMGAPFITFAGEAIDIVSDLNGLLNQMGPAGAGAMAILAGAFIGFAPHLSLVIGLIGGTAGLIFLIGLFATKNEDASQAVLNLKIAILDMAISGIQAFKDLGNQIDDALGGIPGKIAGVIRSGKELLGLPTGNVDRIMQGLQDERAGAEAWSSVRDVQKSINALFEPMTHPERFVERPPIGRRGDFPDFVPPDKDTAGKVDQYKKLLEDALERGNITFREFIAINNAASKQGLPELTRAMAAQLIAERQLQAGTEKTIERIYNLDIQIGKLRYAAEVGGDAVAKMSQDFLASALDLQTKAVSDILSKPTVESATLSAQLAAIDEAIAFAKPGDTERKNALDREADALSDSLKRLKQQSDDLTYAEKQQTDRLSDLNDALDKQKKALDKLISDVAPGQEGTRRRLQAQSDAIDAQKEANDDAKKAISDARELRKHNLDQLSFATQQQIDQKRDEMEEIGRGNAEQRERIQSQLDILNTHKASLQAQAQLADNRLMTEAQQTEKIQALIGNIDLLSGQLVNVSNITETDLVPSYQTAKFAVDDWTTALRDSAVVIASLGRNGAPRSSEHVNVSVNEGTYTRGGPNGADELTLRGP